MYVFSVLFPVIFKDGRGGRHGRGRQEGGRQERLRMPGRQRILGAGGNDG